MAGLRGRRRRPRRATTPGRSAQLRARVDRTRLNLEAQRPTNRVVDATFRWAQLQVEAGGALLAGAIAFRIFLFLLPWVFVIVVGLGIGSDALNDDPRQVARFFGMAGLAASAVQSGTTASAATRWVTFGLAVVALVLSARNLVRALVLAHALLWGVEPRKVRQLTGISIALIGGFLLSTVVVAFLRRAQSVAPGLWLLGSVVLTVTIAATWVAASIGLFPRADGITWRDVLPGSLLFGAGAEVLHVVTVVWFAPYLQSKSQTYGAIGAALAILVWAYLLGRLIIASAALNVVLSTSSRASGPGDVMT
jgi:uncharacterized BrkB/YihY/UPF0761 family membrane protein